MDTDNKQPYISDASKPNPGRIYDYLLGGHHNFEIDRKVAEDLMKMAPFVSDLVKYVRWFLQEAIRQLLDRGFTNFLDFASGLPTVDHIHWTAPKGTKVIYSDNDPITVEYGKDIIGNNQLIKYELCDIKKPEILLESDIVKTFFGNDHKIAIGFSGICWFLSDEDISNSMKVLYDWADKGAMLYVTDGDIDNPSENLQSIMELYKKMNQYIGTRPKKEFIELIKPWKVADPGLLPLEEWYQIAPKVTKETGKAWGGSGVFGGFIIK